MDPLTELKERLQQLEDEKAMLAVMPKRNSNGFTSTELVLAKRRVNDRLKRVRNAIELMLLTSNEGPRQ